MAAAAGMCLRADRAGLLRGDLHPAGLVALDIVESRRKKTFVGAVRSLNDTMRNLFDTWVAFEHHEAWESMQEAKRADGETPSFSAQRLNEEGGEVLLDKIRGLVL